MKVFISGGCKNGKSTYAERIAVSMAASAPPLYYIATMRPSDDEDIARIKRHRKNREGLGFSTVELETDITQILDRCDTRGTFLLDSTTALLSNEMFDREGNYSACAGEKVADGLHSILSQLSDIVIVSDYIYSDATVYDKLTQSYRKALAQADRTCAKMSDVVIEVCYGTLIFHKGRDRFEALKL